MSGNGYFIGLALKTLMSEIIGKGEGKISSFTDNYVFTDNYAGFSE